MRSAGGLARLLDELIEECAGGEDSDVVAKARTRFEERRGRIFQEEELWESATRCFLEWFVLEDEADGGTPRAARARGSSVERSTAVLSWLRSQRSLYRVDEVGSAFVDVTDVVGGGAFRVSEERAFRGVARGDVMEARLVGSPEGVFFSAGFFFHPDGTSQLILDNVRAIAMVGGSRADAVDFCANLRVRCLRYKHVKEQRVYQSGTSEAAAFVATSESKAP